VRLFVTGGTGLVGRHAVAALLARGDHVLALARSAAAAAALERAGADVLRADVTDAAALERGVADCDAVVHAAAMVLDAADWAAYQAANVAPTESLATLAARHAKALVYLSSVAVYGRRRTYDGGRGSVSEDFGLDVPPLPGDYYARSKRDAELALWRVVEATGLRATALRPCVIYGEGDRQFAPRVARVLQLGRGVAPLIGGGRNVLGVVYAGNVAAAILSALDRPGATGPFNVTNDGAITVRRYLERFAAGLGLRLWPVSVPRLLATAGARAMDAAFAVVGPRGPLTMLRGTLDFLGRDNPYTSARAERELLWRPVIGPEEAVERTARTFRRAERSS